MTPASKDQLRLLAKFGPMGPVQPATAGMPMPEETEPKRV